MKTTEQLTTQLIALVKSRKSLGFEVTYYMRRESSQRWGCVLEHPDGYSIAFAARTQNDVLRRMIEALQAVKI